MNAHVRSVYANFLFCSKKSAKDDIMNVHISSVHYIKCQSCPAKLLTNKDMDQHELTTGHKILDLSQKIWKWCGYECTCKIIPLPHFCEKFEKGVYMRHLSSVHTIKCREEFISKSILIHIAKKKSNHIMDQNLIKWKKRTTEWEYNFTDKELDCVLQI